MAFINADRIKETTTTTGTGNIALLGAVLGFRAFYPTLSVGDTFKYFIVSTSGTEWEAGLGTVVSATTLARTTVQSSSNANAAVNFSAGLKEVGIGPTAGGETPWNPVTNTLDISVNALNDVAITSPTVNQVLKYSGTEWTNQADAVNVGTVTIVSVASANGFGGTVATDTTTPAITLTTSITGLLKGNASALLAAVAGTDYVTPTGSAAGLTSFPTLNQNTIGNAATVTTNANLTGPVTSIGNATAIADGALSIAKTSGLQGALDARQPLDAALTALAAGSDFVQFVGPATATKVFTLPDANSTLLVSGGALGTPTSGVMTNVTGTASGLTSGNVTTNANLTGHITSVGNAAVLGSFTSAQLAGALSDETGTGANVFATSPTLVTPLTNSLSAVPVTSGAGNSLILSAGTGVGVGAGGNVETKPGTQGSSGGDGRNYWRTSGSINTRPSGGWTANTSNVVAYSYISPNGHNTFNIGPDESNWSGGIATHYYSDTPLSVRHPSESSSFKYIAAFYTSNANKSMILLGTSLTEAHVSASFAAGSTPIDLVLSSAHSISPYYIQNLRLKTTGETQVTGFLTAPYVRTTSVTVANLTAAATAGAGARAFVSDATLTTFASPVAGGGVNGVPVYSNGANWFIG